VIVTLCNNKDFYKFLRTVAENSGGNFSGKFSLIGSCFKIDAQFAWQNSMPFSDRDRSLKSGSYLSILKFRPQRLIIAIGQPKSKYLYKVS
jgi:hypothetical protein